MLFLVMYDISDNKIQSRVSKLCKDYGLYRIQKSVFIGDIRDKNKKAFYENIKEYNIPQNNSVYIIPLSKQNINNTISIGGSFDKRLILNELHSIII